MVLLMRLFVVLDVTTDAANCTRIRYPSSGSLCSIGFEGPGFVAWILFAKRYHSNFADIQGSNIERHA